MDTTRGHSVINYWLLDIKHQIGPYSTVAAGFGMWIKQTLIALLTSTDYFVNSIYKMMPSVKLVFGIFFFIEMSLSGQWCI